MNRQSPLSQSLRASMIESVDFTKEQRGTPNVRYLFILLSFSYMLPWTAMGSLIHYFSLEYDDNYFTILNIAFYGVGLSVTYMQKRLDTYYGKPFCCLSVKNPQILFLLLADVLHSSKSKSAHPHMPVYSSSMSPSCSFCGLLRPCDCVYGNWVRHLGCAQLHHFSVRNGEV